MKGKIVYYRDTTDPSHPTFWKLVDGQDFVYARGEWQTWSIYKSGPSWWRLTGEIGIDQIPQDELPPEIPR